MKKYSVNEVAKILNKNPETIRRWIRDGKLDASFTSKKQGHIITEQMLDSFLSNSPQYAKSVAPLLKTPAGTIAVASTMIGSILAKQYLKNDRIKKTELPPEEISKLIAEDISERKESINKKMKSIEALQKEVEEEKARIIELELLDREINSFSEQILKQKKED